jgi:hypothetical protein
MDPRLRGDDQGRSCSSTGSDHMVEPACRTPPFRGKDPGVHLTSPKNRFITNLLSPLRAEPGQQREEVCHAGP